MDNEKLAGALVMADNNSEIAEVEVHFVLDDNGHWGIGLSSPEARDNLIRSDESSAIRAFSVRVRARKPGVELGPEIDIADRDTEVATVGESGPTDSHTSSGTPRLPEASRSSQHSS
jgi:hypothetical protein